MTTLFYTYDVIGPSNHECDMLLRQQHQFYSIFYCNIDNLTLNYKYNVFFNEDLI